MKKILKSIAAILLCIFFILSIVGFTKLNLNTNVFALLPETPGIKNLKKYNAVFASLEKFSFSVVSQQHDLETLFSASEYAAAALNKHPFFRGASHQFSLLSASEVKEFYDKQLPNLLSEDDLQKIDTSSQFINSRIEQIFEQLVEIGPAPAEIRSDPLQFSHVFWRKLQLGNLNSKIVRGAVVAKDEKALLLNVPSSEMRISNEKAQQLWTFLYDLQQSVATKFSGISLVIIGGKRVMLDNTSAIWRDAQLTSSLATAALAILMLLTLKNFILFPLLFIPVVFGIFVGIGISSLFAPQLSLITLGLGAVLIGVSVDYVIHYLVHFENAPQQFKIFKPMSFAAFSTCGALSFLFFSDFPVHQETAWFVATGIFSSFLFVVIVFPTMCNKLRKTKRERSIVDLPKILHRKESLLTSIACVLLSLFFTIAALYYIFELQFVANLEQFNYTKPQTKQNEDTFFSIWGNQKGKIAVVVHAPTLEEALLKNDALHNNLHKVREVSVLTKTFHLLPSLARMQKNHEAWKRHWTDEKQQRLSRLFTETCKEYGFSQRAFSPFFESLHKPNAPQQIAPLLENKVFAQFLAHGVQQHNNKWYIQNIVQMTSDEALKKLQQHLNDPAIFIVHRRQILSEVSEILLNWAWTAIIVIGIYICVLFFAYFVHIELVIIGLMPLALSLLWIFGAMGYFGIPLNLFSVLLIVFVLGLGVDYSTFLVTSYVEEIGTQNALLPTTRSAILLSAMTTLIAFGVLIIAEHPALKSLGFCVLFAMSAVLFNTAFLAPIVLRYFIPPQRKSHPVRLITALNSLFCFILYFGGILLLTLVIFPVVAVVEKIFRYDTRRFCLYLIEIINRNIMYLSIGSKIHFDNFPKDMRGYIVVVNHTNTVDIPLFNGMPFTKVTMVKWFWKYPLVNFMLKKAGFLRAPSPQDKFHAHEWEQECRELLNQGYNILFFPEGTRAKSFKMSRFRMGAFRLATSTKAPVLPVCFHGTRWVMDRKRFVVRDCTLYASALPAITAETEIYQQGPRPLARHVKKLLLEEYERLSEKEFASKVQINLIRDCYRYIDSFFDVYLNFKLKLDRNYTQVVTHIPRSGKILDLGCGIGFLSQLMVYSAENRQVWGVDYSAKKIDIANRSRISYTKDSLNFIQADISKNLHEHFSHNFFDAVLCCDVLHYLNEKNQRQLIVSIFDYLQPKGTLVIRQDISEKGICRRAKFEKWAKKIGFNHFSESVLFYPQQSDLQEMLQQAGFQLVESKCQIPGQITITAQKT
ncbi:trifunctional MMPL family transporter/lysophospholipid acyltransferase/class I SAM-dependent methyltransferase [Candidatus Uabimicrobium amorphum]|uniref:Glycerol acyltransferase n=1 Tax=Uabimicrobium amorphum TaxID=2596890 RepID=A0A5S9IQX6_UABAM|nr:trifunctional MMPL family transporter/lysophospholipid acyltransferase/class I SAM-dependent methyltransferase [Candidatus Uabimicrobium amorphum]BBM85530.1 glycerol acyltransferase [Candidatus Uabimicrobium amorphum]